MSSSFTGTIALVRLALRRDRFRLPVWLLLFAVMAGGSASATIGLFPTEGSRVRAAESINSAPSLVALYGRIYDPTSIGALALFKVGGMGAAFVAILAILTVVRHTRAEEEAGRLELVGATAVGRRAPLTAALSVVAVSNVALALLTGAALAAGGLPVEGSFAFGIAWACVGIAFAGVAGVTAQLTSSARTASGLAIAVLGVVYVLRAMGDAAGEGGPGWLSWLSPVGWGQQFRPFAGNRWWLLGLFAAFGAVVTVVAYALVARRDHGAGLLGDRPGPARAGRLLSSPFGLAWRLHRGSVLAWSVGFALLGALLGNLASTVGSLLDSDEAREMINRLGGTQILTDAFLAAELGFVGVGASAFGMHIAMRLGAEEAAGRVEPLLAATVGRVRWAASHLAVALVGTTSLMLSAGLAAGLAHAAAVGDAGRIGPVLAGAVVQLPAAWLMTGVVIAAFGLLPRFAVAGWAAFAAFLFLGEVGPVLQLDQWLLDLSPFAHVPKLPGHDVDAIPLLALTGLAGLLVAVGLVAFRRRDLA